MINDQASSPSEDTAWKFRSIFDSAGDGMVVIDLELGIVVDANPAACLMHGYTRHAFIGLHLTAFIHPKSQKLFNEYVQVFLADGNFKAQVVQVRQDGSIFFSEWHGSPFMYQGRQCLLGIIRDVNQRVKAEQVLHQRELIRVQEQVRLLQISQTLLSTLEFQPGLILDQLHDLIHYTHAGFFAFEGSKITVLAMRGSPQLDCTPALQIELADPQIMHKLFLGNRAVFIGDVSSNTPQAIFLLSLIDPRVAALLANIRSWMWVPLTMGGRWIGAFGVAHELPDYFTVHHANLAQSVSNMAAITMVNAERYWNAQASAVLEERQRLARNLHDAINQSLFSAGLIAEVLPRLWERDQEEARRSILDLLRLTRGAQAEMRALLAELRPSTLTDSALGDLLYQLGNALSGRTNIPVTVTVKEEFILPTEVQVAFYRVCQEALFNVAKHSKASQVEICLCRERTDIVMHIKDDGQGFDLQKISAGHYGITMMRERAEAAGVYLSITSLIGCGTEITLRWTPPTILEVV